MKPFFSFFPDEHEETMVDSFSFVSGDHVEIKFDAKCVLRVVVLVPRERSTEFEVSCNGRRLSTSSCSNK